MSSAPFVSLAPLDSEDLSSTPPSLPAEVNREKEAEQRSLTTVEDAIAAIRSSAAKMSGSSGGSKPAQDPLLFLPPLLSRLPSGFPGDDTLSSTVHNNGVELTSSCLPDIDTASLALHRALHEFRPVTPLYAVTPYEQAFNWTSLQLDQLDGDLTASVGQEASEWYIVAFRSKRRVGFTPEEAYELYKADREAHEEAVKAGGLLMYWYGSPFPADPLADNHEAHLPWSVDLSGRNLATCIWQSRGHAIAAMHGEKHKRAAQLASRSYESYTLERYTLRKEAGELGVHVRPWQAGST